MIFSVKTCEMFFDLCVEARPVHLSFYQELNAPAGTKV
jgi:hypothetical protein